MVNRRLKVILILIIIIIIEIIYFWYIAPRVSLNKMIITANFEVLESDIFNLTYLKPQMPIMQIDNNKVEQELLAEGMIHEAHVRRSFLGHVHIKLRGYNPTVALITAEGKTLFLDQEGLLFNSNKKTGIFPPLLQGAILEVQEQSLRLMPSMQPLLQALSRLKERDNDIHSNIAGIRAIMNKEELQHWEFSFIHLQSKALLASYLQEEDIRRAFLVLQILEEQERFLGEVDFRTNEIVFRQRR